MEMHKTLHLFVSANVDISVSHFLHAQEAHKAFSCAQDAHKAFSLCPGSTQGVFFVPRKHTRRFLRAQEAHKLLLRAQEAYKFFLLVPELV